MPGDATSDDDYLHGHHDSVLRSHRRRTAEDSAAYLLPHLWPNAEVLDVGCGPGTITVGLARAVRAGRVVGIDAAPEILEEARGLAAASGAANCTFEPGDAYRLHFPDHAFDVVHAHQVLQHLADPVTALREMRRVCRPGGIVAVRDADYGAMTWYPASPVLETWRDLYRAVARGVGGEPDAGRHLLAWARRAGFSHLTPSASAWCFATPELRAWWGGLWAERVAESRFAEQAVALGLATAADLEHLARAWRDFAANADGSFFVLHGELLCVP